MVVHGGAFIVVCCYRIFAAVDVIFLRIASRADKPKVWHTFFYLHPITFPRFEYRETSHPVVSDLLGDDSLPHNVVENLEGFFCEGLGDGHTDSTREGKEVAAVMQCVANVRIGGVTGEGQFFDVGIPADDLEAQEKRLTTKFDRLAEPVVGAEKAKRIEELVLGLDDAEGVADLMAAAV